MDTPPSASIHPRTRPKDRLSHVVWLCPTRPSTTFTFTFAYVRNAQIRDPESQMLNT
jgi:hypothetical protein